MNHTRRLLCCWHLTGSARPKACTLGRMRSPSSSAARSEWHIVVRVAPKRKGFWQDSFWQYEVRASKDTGPCRISMHRFSDFVALHNLLWPKLELERSAARALTQTPVLTPSTLHSEHLRQGRSESLQRYLNAALSLSYAYNAVPSELLRFLDMDHEDEPPPRCVEQKAEDDGRVGRAHQSSGPPAIDRSTYDLPLPLCHASAWAAFRIGSPDSITTPDLRFRSASRALASYEKVLLPEHDSWQVSGLTAS